ncbi:MAG: hypothetical protein RLZZ297_1849 [Chloroflexota bacterium]
MTATTVLAPLGVPVRFFDWRGYRIALHEAGSGPTVLLVHSINAAAGSHELRRPFAHLQQHYRVVALDLIGFGDSDRPDIVYDAALYSALIADVARHLGGVFCLYAVSLAGAYACTAAVTVGALVERLMLICPTGLEDLVTPKSPQTWLRGPIGRVLFRGLVTRGSIRYFLQSTTYASPAALDDAMSAAFVRAAQRPGAAYAPLCFVAMVSNCDLRPVLPLLTQPVHIVWGAEARTTPPTRLPAFLAALPQATSAVFAGSMAVHDENAAAVAASVDAFFAQTTGKPSEQGA